MGSGASLPKKEKGRLVARLRSVYERKTEEVAKRESLDEPGRVEHVLKGVLSEYKQMTGDVKNNSPVDASPSTSPRLNPDNLEGLVTGEEGMDNPELAGQGQEGGGLPQGVGVAMET
ncbi:unnamed protein product, partial [Discosporangium mesarthrocarpum]